MDEDLRINKQVGARSFRVEFKSLVDPTAGSIAFGLQSISEELSDYDGSGTASGTWVTYEAKTRKATADTPTFGTPSNNADYDVSALPSGTYRLWYTLIASGEVVVMPHHELITIF